MLGIDNTGYEGKFDFTPAGKPSLIYLLATVPRTGSSYLSHLLWRTGCLGAPLEYLNFDAAGHFGFASDSADNQQWLWRSALNRRTSPNGVFGFKAFPMQLQALQGGNPVLLAAVLRAVVPRDRPARVIHLARRDRLAHAVSWARATLSGVWRREQEDGAAEQIAYSQAAIDRAYQWIDSQSDLWERMFRDLGIEPLRLWYEDAVAAPQQTVAAVAAYLDVTLDPAEAVDVPMVEKQAETGAQAWRERAAAPRD